MSLLLALMIFGMPLGTSISLTWQAPTTNEDGSELTNLKMYRLYEKHNSGNFRLRAGITGKVTRMTYTPNDAGTYTLYLTAVNSDKQESKPSNEVVVVVERPVPNPSQTPAYGD